MATSHVLVPLDGSPLADDALAYALETFDCRLTVLNVVTPMDSPMSEGGVLEPDERRQTAASDRADRIVEQARQRADAAGREIDTAVETGDPAETIVGVATDRDADQIVMGSHGGDRNALTRRLLGTVATDVVGEAPMTVTVVR